jgi:tRNA-Thr(GGU) m(6)t(6)A37 methyltransferase TsaA
MPNKISFDIIAKVKSPYQEKFAIPRQPGLATAALGEVHLIGKTNNLDCVRDLQHFSHIWLLFVFHDTAEQGWQPLVKPPRLGGNKKTGVLATRSTFRPNPIGMSVVKLDQVCVHKGNVILKISGHDLLNNTPIIDIKPYLPYSDSHQEAKASYAQSAPVSQITLTFSEQAQTKVQTFSTKYAHLKLLIEQVLSQDPRPAYKKQKLDNKVYGIHLYDLNITWQMLDLTNMLVLDIQPYK